MKPSPARPLSGQESVWDYPRPPRLEPCPRHIRVMVDDLAIVDSERTYRVLETSHPPVYYIPPDDVRMDLMHPARHGSYCEWKGRAHYFSLACEGRVIENIAWCYPNPSERFAPIANYLAFYPSKADACFVDDERVKPQDGDFYGGWITGNIVGPFKGGPATQGW